jgi:hypothetical protein
MTTITNYKYCCEINSTVANYRIGHSEKFNQHLGKAGTPPPPEKVSYYFHKQYLRLKYSLAFIFAVFSLVNFLFLSLLNVSPLMTSADILRKKRNTISSQLEVKMF